MEETPRRKARGLSRVAFIAILPAIKTELAEGYTAKLIFEKHADKLAGKISYPQFVRYVRPLREASLLPTRPTPDIPRELPDVIAPAIPATGAPPRIRPEPTARPTFVHDGRTKEGEAERLFGPGYLPGSRK